ncbi:hypothetical protein JCM14036_00150 [Desulfotomaculum defluvii]
MICPKCKCEYREGFSLCADCKVPLVKELKQEKTKIGPVKLVTVFSSMDLGVVAVAKSLLESSGIMYFAKGESLQGLFGVGNIGFNVISGPVQIQVKEEDVQDAKILLGEL